MKKLLLLFFALLCLTGTAKAATAELSFDELYSGGGVLGLQFSDKVKNLAGQRITIKGFMAPPLKACLLYTSGHRARPPSFPSSFHGPPVPEAVPPSALLLAIPLHINRILAHVAPERGPAQKALSRSSQGCHPTLPSQPKYGLRVATSRCSASN